MPKGSRSRLASQRKHGQEERLREQEILRRNQINDQQDSEIELLSQIYFDEFVPHDDITDYDFPHCFSIRILPRTGLDQREAHVEIFLKVRLPRDYPFQSPACSISQAKGLPLNAQQELKEQIDKLAKEKIGEVCVFELANFCHDYLGNHNCKFAGSVYEEMTHRKEQEKARISAQAREREIAKQAEEEDALKQRMKEEMSKRKERAFKSRERDRAQSNLQDEMFAMDDLEGPESPVSLSASGHSIRGSIAHSRHCDADLNAGRIISLRSESDSEEVSESSSNSSHSDTDSTQSEDGDLIDLAFDATLGTPMEQYFAQRAKSLEKELTPSSQPIKCPSSSKLTSSKPATSSSRYRTNFEELGVLGCGGFGEVVKARNKLDGHLYGIKKVKMSCNSMRSRMRILREVTTIARLHHKYVVRYYQAWTEGSSDSTHSAFASDVSDLDGNGVHDWMNRSTGFESEEDNFLNDFSPIAGSHPMLHRSPPKSKNETEMLYIQFEYCPKQTLRDVIDEGLARSPDKIWRIFRQMLEALEYIHGKGIVHRDMKPANVFFDETDDIKIGDFGLATATDSASLSCASPHPNNTSGTLKMQRNMSTNSLSGAVGTPYYCSPEQEKEGSVVDQKTDMYALGVVFFEMWLPFNTLMERHEILIELRRSGRVPSIAVDKLSSTVVKITEWLMQRSPEDRPNAAELLHSGLVPLAEDEQYLHEALHALTSANSAFRPRVVDVLFSIEPDRAVDLCFDVKDRASIDLSDVEQLGRMNVFDRVQSVFRNHGAVRVSSPLLLPKVTTMRESSPVLLLDVTGTLVQLPHSLTVPFARFVALRNINDVRRYDISRVFRQSVVGGQPSESCVCDFDIVFPSGLSRKRQVIYHCEVIRVVDEVLNAFSSTTNRFCIYINHLQLLESVLDVLVPSATHPKARKAVCSLIAQLGRTRWSSIRRTLLHEYYLPEDNVTELGEFVTLKGNVKTVLPRIESSLKAHGIFSGSAAANLESLSLLFRFLDNVKITQKILLHAGLVGDHQLYGGGLVFQVVQEGRGDKRSENIAVGGRYDNLISRFRPPRSSSKVCAVGVSIAIESVINSSLPKHTRKKTQSSSGSHLDDNSVVLFANGGKMVEERFGVASLLWSQGIRAEYSFPEHSHNASTMPKYCRSRRIRWLVVFRPGLLSEGLVKVVDLKLATQEEVNLLSLVEHITRVVTSSDSKSASFGPSSGVAGREPQVEFLHPDTTVLKGHQCVQHARTAQNLATPLVGGLQANQYALFGVYIPLEIVRNLGNSYYENGSGGMKAFVDSGHHNWKDHLRLLSSAILDAVSKHRLTLRYIFVYSVEDRRCDLLVV